MKKKITIIIVSMLISLTLYTQNIKTYRISDTLLLNEVEIKSRTLFSDTVGIYDQPEWSTVRKSPTARVYLTALPGTISFEHWFEIRTYKDKVEMRTREELTFGLGKRFQLDLYLLGLKTFDGNDGPFILRGISTEIRYALADWGKIFGNPTLYFEYQILNNSYQVIEPKLLFGDVFGKKKNNMWAINFVYEGNIAPIEDRFDEFQTTISYHHMFGNVVSVGVAGQYTKVWESKIYNGTYDCLVGPSLQLTLSKKAFLDIEPLIGVFNSEKISKVYFIFGWKI